MIQRKTTKELLGESLHELAKERAVDQITVKEIARNCGVSTVTFYHHFRDKYELIAWIFNYQMEVIFWDFADGAESWRQVLAELIGIMGADPNFYRNAFRHTGEQTSFFDQITARGIELLTEMIRKTFPERMNGELLFAIRFYVKGAAHTLVDWLESRRACSAEELADYLFRALPTVLQPYLT